MKLLQSFNDTEFIKQIMKNREKYDLKTEDIVKLIKNLNDSEYVKQVIENWKQYDIDGYSIVELLKYINDPEYIKQVMENEEKYGVNGDNIVELLKSLNDLKYTKQVIENRGKYGVNGDNIVELLKYIKDPEYTKRVIENREQYGVNSNNIIELIISVGDIVYLENIIDTRQQYGLDNKDIFALIANLDRDEYIKIIKKIIEDREQYGLSNKGVVWQVRGINDPKYTKKIIENREQYGLDGYNVTELLKLLRDPEYTKKIIDDREKYGLNGYNVTELLKLLYDREYTKKIIDDREKYGLNGYNVTELLEMLRDREYTKKIIKDRERYGIEDSQLKNLIKSTGDSNFIKDCIKNRKKFNLYSYFEEDLTSLITVIRDKDVLKEIIKNREEYQLSARNIASVAIENFSGEELLELIDKEVSEIYRSECASTEFINEHLSKFLEIEKVNIAKDVLLQMSEMNENILKGNLDILGERYINTLGAEKVNQISCYSDIADLVLGLKDGELKLLGKVLDKYMDMTKGEEWTPLAKKILENIGSYKELVSNLEENENISIDKLIPILIHSNNFDIKTLEDVENFQEIKRKKCEELINGETLEEKQKAVLLKVFGQGMRETKKIISRFEEDIDEIEDEDLKAYIKSLQEILKIENPEVLKEIFEQVEELETINPLLMERMLKTEYCKLYNRDLFNLKNAEKLPDGENVYNAGTDFKMIITSVGAFYTNNSVIDYKKDWNKPKIGSQHFCASYIRNDMLGHAPVPHICYGFCEMAEDSLMLSGPMDLASSGVSFESTARRNERYLAPNNQIAKTIRYNEMDFRRIQGGKKKQPDYIVVFRKDGKIPNIDIAEKASKDFGGLPIVVIDEDECLASERKKAEEMFEEYKKTHDPQIGFKLREKLRNNRVTDYDFCRDTDMDIVLDSLENQKREKALNVSMEDLEEIYGEVSGKERQEETGKIRMVYERIRMIKGRKDNSDGR